MMVRNPTTPPPTSRAARPGGPRGPAFSGRIGRSVLVLAAACIGLAALPGPAAAIQTLEAADHRSRASGSRSASGSRRDSST